MTHQLPSDDSVEAIEETESRISGCVRALGVHRGGVLLVHSSLRAMGPVPGGAETVVRGLSRALGEAGTLLMPALSYENVGAYNPVFDVLRTPSCVGALPEYFRTRPGTVRSVHPTHSVCGVGPQTAWLLDGHQRDTTPCGENSPFRRLRDAGGQVLFLGCGMRPNTSMHAIEEMVGPPYLFDGFVDYGIILPGGEQTTMRVRQHNFNGWRQRYDRLGFLLDGNGLRHGKVLAATADLVECKQMWEVALAALARDLLHFVEERR